MYSWVTFKLCKVEKFQSSAFIFNSPKLSLILPAYRNVLFCSTEPTSSLWSTPDIQPSSTSYISQLLTASVNQGKLLLKRKFSNERLLTRSKCMFLNVGSISDEWSFPSLVLYPRFHVIIFLYCNEVTLSCVLCATQTIEMLIKSTGKSSTLIDSETSLTISEKFLLLNTKFL